jgi:uncharacterized protein YutE (UPF0331/DUF86 family)
MEGGRTTEYKEIAQKLGELGIVEKSFARGPLSAMAGYRNRLTHFYADVAPEELRRIIKEKLDDLELFLSAIKRLLQHPGKWGLEIE